MEAEGDGGVSGCRGLMLSADSDLGRDVIKAVACESGQALDREFVQGVDEWLLLCRALQVCCTGA
jgi:hypothetical protein